MRGLGITQTTFHQSEPLEGRVCVYFMAPLIETHGVFDGLH